MKIIKAKKTMTELELYKYINDNNIEWHRQDNDGTPDIIMFPLTFQIDEFVVLLRIKC